MQVCFNPRPTNWSGDCHHPAKGVDQGKVSIHARPIGRAIASGNGVRPWRPSFNPRPTNWSGDFRQFMPVERFFPVSIHARPIGRAIGKYFEKRLETFLFQSTPDQLVGRLRRSGHVAQPPSRFNPRPTNWSGDSATRRRCGPVTSVSIHARPIGRAINQPRAIVVIAIPVSIHARPIGRAINWTCRSGAMIALFQSTPDQLVGRLTPSIAPRPKPISFQSTPDQLVGRFSCASSSRSMAISFNPRPTNWSGDYQL